jgi:hypothetical protein
MFEIGEREPLERGDRRTPGHVEGGFGAVERRQQAREMPLGEGAYQRGFIREI